MYKKGSQTSILKELVVEINGIKIERTQIKRLLFNQSIYSHTINGSLIFDDTTSLNKRGELKEFSNINLYMIDNFDNEVSLDFVIMDISSSKNTDFETISLQLVDDLTFEYYEPKVISMKSCSLKDLIKTNKEIIDKAESMVLEDICSPLNSSYNSFLEYIKRVTNTYIYRQNNSLILSPKPSIDNGKANNKFILNANNKNYKFNIYELNSSKSSTEHKIFSKNKSTLINLEYTNTYTFDENSSITNVDLSINGENKLKYINSLSSNYIKLKNTVNGNFENLLGDTVELDLLNTNGEDSHLNGLYVIEEITNVIDGADFVQNITFVK